MKTFQWLSISLGQNKNSTLQAFHSSDRGHPLELRSSQFHRLSGQYTYPEPNAFSNNTLLLGLPHSNSTILFLQEPQHQEILALFNNNYLLKQSFE